MDTELTFGDLLRRHRDSANLTQEALAARAGLTPQAIGMLERGERRRPHKYTVDKLAEVLDLTDRTSPGSKRLHGAPPSTVWRWSPPTTLSPRRPHPWSGAITKRRAPRASFCARRCAC